MANTTTTRGGIGDEATLRRTLNMLPMAVLLTEKGSIIYANAQATAIFGDGQAIDGARLSDFIDTIQPNAAAEALLPDTSAPPPSEPIEATCRSREGVIHNLRLRLLPQEDGTVQVIGEVVEPPKRVASVDADLFDSITDVCFVLDNEYHVIRVNQAASRVTRLNKSDLLGTSLVDYDDLRGSPHFDVYSFVKETRTPQVFRTSAPLLPRSVPGAFELRVYPLQEGLLCIAHDISLQLQAEHNLRAQRALEAALRDTAQALNSTLKLNEVLDRVLGNLGRVVKHDMANIMLIKDGKAQVARSQNYAERAINVDVELNVEDTPSLRYMLKEKSPVVIEDVRSDAKWVQQGSGNWLRGYAGAPIIVHGEVIGFLNIHGAEVDTFTEEDARRLQTFADQAGAAIRNARLYERIREQVNELEALNRELQVFAHAAAHELRSPLQVIMGMADFLVADLEGEVPTESLESLQTIVDYGDKMNRIISDLFHLANLRNNPEALTHVHTSFIVDAVAQGHKPTLESRKVVLTVEAPLPDVHAHGPLLERVMANLLENAVKYIGLQNPEPRITIRGKKQGSWVRLEVEDNGIGVPDEKKEAIFGAFARANIDQGHGYGLGLAIVKQIVEGMGGTIGVEDAPGGGSIFWFTLQQPRE